ncbi:MAG: ATP-dependent DNA ligase [Crenarchaeota archaeon 13_1_40CM_2_52_14]|nr:MAG: ATP-dependent DNA ligase [Crenarchaeota archaeon 13_1_40CM_2_52_14]
MLYSRIVETYTKIEATTKRLEITRLLVELIDATPRSIIDKVVYLTQGKLYPDFLGIELGVAEKLLFRALTRVTGQAESKAATLYKKLGDLGTVAEQLLKDRTQVSFQRKAPTVEEVYNVFDTIAHEVGQGSIDSKVRHLTTLLGKASPTEAKYITRMALGRLRLGVADMTLLDALAISLGGGKESRLTLERAYNRSSDLGYVARTLATGGMKAIESLKVTVGRPIRPMLAERLSEAKAILEKMNGECAAEYKYDGLRIQAHVSSNGTTLFSRRLENITDQFPDVQQLLKENLEGIAIILEGEAVPVDPATGELLPFQLISQRRGRKYDLEKTIQDIPVAFFPFDLLYADTIDYTDRPYLERRERLRELIPKNERLDLSQQKICNDPEQLDDFMQEAVADGCEGLMIKSIGRDSTYKAGARGWTWIKYKRDYKSEMQDSVDLAVVGAFAGKGRRGGTYGALLLAAYDKRNDLFRTVCKCGSGFTDEDLDKLPKLLEKYSVDHRHSRLDSKIEADVWFVAGLVLEIVGAEITLSPIHTCGMNSIRPGAGLAVRFPRFTGKYREDKSAEDSTTTDEIVEMYRAQLKKVTENTTVEAA